MYYDLYQSIKGLVAAGLDLPVDPDTGRVREDDPERLRDIQWFNNQYEGDPATLPALYVEFAPLAVGRLSKDAEAAAIVARLHVVTAVTRDADGHVPDLSVLRHERLALGVLDAVEGRPLDFRGGSARPARLAAWTHLHKYAGKLVTVVELQSKG